MANTDQLMNARRGTGSRFRSSITKTLTVAGNTTVKDNITLPRGANFRGVAIDTPTAISGTPTTCNVRVGTADTGQQVVADVDAKAQGHIAATIVAAFDRVHTADLAPTVIYVQVTTAGGTSSAGTIDVTFDYDGPVP